MLCNQYNKILSLELIANANDLNTVEQLILNGADINYLNRQSWCFLFELIYQNNITSIKYFSNKNMNLHIKDSKNRNALFWAIHFKNNDIFKLLINLGLDFNQNIISGLPALHYIIYKENILLLEYLLSKNINLNKEDCFGNTAMYYAKQCKNKKIYYLIKNITT